MKLYLRIDINIAAFILLGTVLLIAYNRLDRKDRLNRYFLITSAIVILEIAFETITCIVNGKTGPLVVPILVVFSTCLFITAPILTYYWSRFITTITLPDSRKSRLSILILLIPLALNTFITLLSPVYGYVFYVDSNNVYHRGDLFFLSAVITYFYLAYSMVILKVNRKKLMRQEFLPLVIFGILPIIGGILQSLFYGVLLMWSCAGFSLVIVYNFLSSRMVYLDKLTGAWTRESFEYYISRRFEHTEEHYGVIFIDLDGLKAINDKYGHLQGDNALKQTVSILKSTIRRTDIVARIGGDEFIVIFECDTVKALNRTVDRIRTRFNEFNKNSSNNYNIEYSYGAGVFDSGEYNFDDFMCRLDELMYAQKRQKKSMNV